MGSSDRMNYSWRNKSQLAHSRVGARADSEHDDALVGMADAARVVKLTKTLIRANGLTLIQAAHKIGISKTTLEQLLIKRRLTNRTLVKLRIWAAGYLPAK